MTSKERVFTALAHKQPDRCPVDLLLEDATRETLFQYFNTRNEDDLHDILHSDIQFVFPERKTPGSQHMPDGTWFSEWGIQYRNVKNGYCEYSEMVSHPLAYVEELEDVKKYDAWPDPDAYDWAHFSDKIGNLHEKRVLKLHLGGLYELAWELRGMEAFWMDMVEEPEIAHYIMDKVCNYWCEYARRAFEVADDKIDMVYTFDDIATQQSLILSPKLLEEFVYPYHRKMNAFLKSHGKKILYHSCGSVVSQIGNLRDLPIDLLNPLQPRAAGMDFEFIKSTYGDTLSFHGGIDIQHTLPNGTVEDVQNEVRRAVSILGKNGGYVLASAHYIQNDTPVENILAMYDLALRN